MPTFNRFAASALGALALTACSPTIPPPRPLPPAAPPSAIDQAATQAEENPANLYSYTPVGKRDPFRDLSAPSARMTFVPAGADGRKLTTLQKFDIDQLQLRFAVTATSSPMATILDPNGRAHNVRIGDFVGKNWGKVSHIGREEITITETIADTTTGKVFPVYIPMRMPQTMEDKKFQDQMADVKEGRP